MGRGQSQQSRTLIDAAADILEEINPATVRAVCYRLFTQGVIRSMAKSETNKVSRLLARSRECGGIPWEWIVDETREPECVPAWATPAEFKEAARRSYRRDYWAQQPRRVEIWSEKGTVRGTLAPVLRQYAVTFRVLHGYASATAIRDIVMDARAGQRPIKAFYVGDWDPSGLHMSHVDLPLRLNTYLIQACGWDAPPDDLIDLSRLALTDEDVHGGGLPSFAADTKRSDPRWRWYMATFGNTYRGRCWEVDALSPVILRARVGTAIRGEINAAAWERCARGERAEQESLTVALDQWSRILRQASK
jgi:hypothetical protein